MDSNTVDVEVPELEDVIIEQAETSTEGQVLQEGEELIKDADLSDRIVPEDTERTQFPDVTETSREQDNHEDLLKDDGNMDQPPEEDLPQEEDKNAELMEIVPPDENENHEEQLRMEESYPDPDTNAEIEEEEEEEENNHATTLQLGRVKKIMKICLVTNEAVDENTTLVKKSVKKGRGSKKANDTTKNQGTSSFMLSKEAIYLTAVATELFVAAIAQQSGRITASTNKKTMTNEHLRRALSDSEQYEFLSGCFQPSILIE